MCDDQSLCWQPGFNSTMYQLTNNVGGMCYRDAAAAAAADGDDVMVMAAMATYHSLCCTHGAHETLRCT
jgi:hypothetical protein